MRVPPVVSQYLGRVVKRFRVVKKVMICLVPLPVFLYLSFFPLAQVPPFALQDLCRVFKFLRVTEQEMISVVVPLRLFVEEFRSFIRMPRWDMVPRLFIQPDPLSLNFGVLCQL